jgi:hypothetical protein
MRLVQGDSTVSNPSEKQWIVASYGDIKSMNRNVFAPWSSDILSIDLIRVLLARTQGRQAEKCTSLRSYSSEAAAREACKEYVSQPTQITARPWTRVYTYKPKLREIFFKKLDQSSMTQYEYYMRR